MGLHEDSKHVVEEDRAAHGAQHSGNHCLVTDHGSLTDPTHCIGQHSSLCQIPRDWRLPPTDGPVRREAFRWYVANATELYLARALESLFADVWLTRRLTGTLYRASQFLAEELPIRLAHRVQELDNLPDGLSEMPSVRRVHDWYAQSFEVCPTSATPSCSYPPTPAWTNWYGTLTCLGDCNRRSPTSHDHSCPQTSESD